jgi:predicted RNase H-like HicB family nuclease
MTFGRNVVIAITKVSRMQLDHWAQSGIVRPSIKSSSGKGSRREYSFEDLVQLKVAKTLRAQGIGLPKIRMILKFLRKGFLKKSSSTGSETLASLRGAILVPPGLLARGVLGSYGGSQAITGLRYLTNGIDTFIITRDPNEALNALKKEFVFSLSLEDIIGALKNDLAQLIDPSEYKVTVSDKKFTVLLTPDLEDGGFTVQCKEIPAAISQGENEQEAIDNIIDALELCLETESFLKSEDRQVQCISLQST